MTAHECKMLRMRLGYTIPRIAEVKLGTYRGGASALAAIRAQVRQVENDRTLSASEKRKRLDELNAERNRIAAEVDAEARGK